MVGRNGFSSRQERLRARASSMVGFGCKLQRNPLRTGLAACPARVRFQAESAAVRWDRCELARVHFDRELVRV